MIETAVRDAYERGVRDGYAGICVSPDGKIYDKDNMQDAR
jgi:putative hemolysin